MTSNEWQLPKHRKRHTFGRYSTARCHATQELKSKKLDDLRWAREEWQKLSGDVQMHQCRMLADAVAQRVQFMRKSEWMQRTFDAIIIQVRKQAMERARCCSNTLTGHSGNTSAFMLNSIVLYGIGSFSVRFNPKLQLAAAIALAERIRLHAAQCCTSVRETDLQLRFTSNDVKAFIAEKEATAEYLPLHVYDPLFTPLEISVVQMLGAQIICYNEEGARVVKEPTLFFMPFCPPALYRNVIRSNLGPNLHNIVFLGNNLKACLTNSVQSTRDSSETVTEQSLSSIFSFLEEFFVPVIENDYSFAFHGLCGTGFSCSSLCIPGPCSLCTLDERHLSNQGFTFFPAANFSSELITCEDTHST